MTFDVNSAEAQVMRLYEALDDLGRRMQATRERAEALLPKEGPVDPELAMLLCEIARETGEVQGMASILETLGFAADR